MQREPILRRLTKDIPNPQHDRRCRYGVRSLSTFKAGTVFEFLPETIHTTDEGKVRVMPAIVQLSKPYCTIYDVSLWLKYSALHESCSFDDLLREVGLSLDDSFASSVINHLIQSGNASLDDVRAAIQKAM